MKIVNLKRIYIFRHVNGLTKENVRDNLPQITDICSFVANANVKQINYVRIEIFMKAFT